MSNLIPVIRIVVSPVGIVIVAVLALWLSFRAYRRRSRHLLPGTSTPVAQRSAKRTIMVRILLVLLVVGLYAPAAMMLPRETTTAQSSEHLPDAGSGIVVVDVSGSISAENMVLISDLFDEAIERKLHLGLILFAGDGYVLWGPNVPAEQTLENITRYFKADPETGRVSSLKPWAIGGGTQMIHGILDAVAMHDLFEARGAGQIPIIIVSDLQDHGDSLEQVLEEIGKLRVRGTDVYVVDLNVGNNYYTGRQAEPFLQILDEDAFIRDFSVLTPVSGNGGYDIQSPEFAVEILYAILGFAIVALILIDAFILPRIPAQEKSEREEEST